jgi:ABC-type nitrate/sulfonate/bicarbonate transport system substrate-binding protein
MGYAAKGVPGIAVAAKASEPRNMSLVVLKNGPIKSIDDLKGKRVGVTTAGSLTDWLTRKLSDTKGWGPEGIEVTPMGEMRTRLAAMKSGELAGSVNSIQETFNLVEAGEGRLLATFGDAVPDFHTHAIFAHRKLIAEKPRTPGAKPIMSPIWRKREAKRPSSPHNIASASPRCTASAAMTVGDVRTNVRAASGV